MLIVLSISFKSEMISDSEERWLAVVAGEYCGGNVEEGLGELEGADHARIDYHDKSRGGPGLRVLADRPYVSSSAGNTRNQHSLGDPWGFDSRVMRVASV
jgi:hypothetical protein